MLQEAIFIEEVDVLSVFGGLLSLQRKGLHLCRTRLSYAFILLKKVFGLRFEILIFDKEVGRVLGG